ncbi:ATP-binding protein [Roseateles amylovorans]|uniref:Helix-turn-helix transcriptional regulator n=1 Tax=Roseateles amylovorans TaxID=2978473 RepID=A0ABY6B2I5_9BURK|nr:helix-turn-helix transcriptional regulator [Roseateles amylovorans]UXH79603.1 helix-turn-helix transcriptional regulator [Roseateles amylovorans]
MSCHRFGPFTLLVPRRQLFEGQREIKLGARALDLLVALVERAGAVVSKQDLMAQVWPHEVVEDNTLRVHMAALRKALGSGDGTRYITNIAGRGYSFVAPSIAMAPPPLEVRPTSATLQSGAPDRDASLAAPPRPAALARRTDAARHAALSVPTRNEPSASPDAVPRALLNPTPVAVHRRIPRLDCGLLGREETLDALDRHLARYGFVTLVGPGGIGKTSVAIAVARQVGDRYAQGVWFVDLSMLPATACRVDVALSIAKVIGVETAVEGLFDRIGSRLTGGRQLLILDNCEHVVKAAAALVETLLAPTPGLHLLLTSREPLRVVGEQVHLLPCLPMPDASVSSMTEALHYPAIELFLQRARAADQDFEPTDSDAVWITHICQGLDGVPLAIEHAAAMVRTFGLKALASSLDDRFLLLCGAHRHAISRHQNLEALLRWGYDLLDEREQQLLRWLSVFRGAMPLSDILTFASPELMARHELLAAVHGLVMKSWLFPCPGQDLPTYRLHAVARSFAQQQLMAAGEQIQVGFRHRDLLASRGQPARPPRPWTPPSSWVSG